MDVGPESVFLCLHPSFSDKFRLSQLQTGVVWGVTRSRLLRTTGKYCVDESGAEMTKFRVRFVKMQASRLEMGRR